MDSCFALIGAHQHGIAVRPLYIPANFFWDISVRFLSWECWDFWRRHDHFRRFPKKSEDFRRSPSLPKTSEGELIKKTLIHKIRDHEEGIVIYSFSWFSFLTWVWVNIFLEIVSSKMATTHIFQSDVRNWPASVSRGEIEVFNPQAWDSRLRCESWQVYFVWTKLSSEALYWCHGVRQVQSTPLSISSTQHIWELRWLGTAQQTCVLGKVDQELPWSVCQ